MHPAPGDASAPADDGQPRPPQGGRGTSAAHGRPTIRRILGRSWAGNCPRCDRGALFQSRFRLRPGCTVCGLVYRREPGAMTGQMYLSAVVTEVFAVLLIVLIWVGTDWSPWRSIAVSVPLVIVFSYWFLPKAMALWVGIEFLTDVANRDVSGQGKTSRQEP
jgi:uncharacterized protein (DUF983 family)